MNDEIIYSWCFHDVECFDSTPSAAIIILDNDLESFSSLKIPASNPFFFSMWDYVHSYFELHAMWINAMRRIKSAWIIAHRCSGL